MIHLRREQPSHNTMIVEHQESSCSFSGDSSENSSLTDLTCLGSEDSNSKLQILAAEQEAAPPRKKARTERNQMRSICRRGALEHSQLLKNVMAACMADDLEDDALVEANDPLRGSKRRRDSENCTDTSISEQSISGVDAMFTLMSMKPGRS